MSKFTSLIRHLAAPVLLQIFTEDHRALAIAAATSAVAYGWSWLEKEVKGHL